ncbi:putative RNA-directed DNA polymerase [Aphis craccivora]|uniref:Putative RNA-directed DNA polymerase n=1 Tax=Aphis craccivora TaxID=307492 RepID=A0A6G0ZKH5_APHCR|nr:putative RNA-directed DNA polymerase [Aphis craccivora]
MLAVPYDCEWSLLLVPCTENPIIITDKLRNNQYERMETLGATHLHEFLSSEPTATQKLFIFLKKSTLFKEI